jgi:glycosyltransferase involved in cell wall biosynthesis
MVPKLSVVAPLFNEEDTLDEFYQRITRALALWQFELIFVDDGSRDNSRVILQRLAEQDPRVKVIGLSRNFGHERASTAGLYYASGDCVVLIDSDLQDPPELIPRLVDKWCEGYDVVYGIRMLRQGESLFKKVTSHLFYRLLNFLADVPIPADVGDFRLMSRRVVETINQMPESRRFVRGMVAWLGYRQVGVGYTRAPRHNGRTKYSLTKLWHLSIEAIVAYSQKPLKLGTRLGFLAALLGFILAIRTIVIKLQHPHAIIPGWASVFVAILVLGGLNLIVTGIVGEYIGRILDEVRGRPLFLVDYTENVEVPRQPPGPTVVRHSV